MPPLTFPFQDGCVLPAIVFLQLEEQNKLVTQVALYSLLPFVVAFSFIFFIFYRQNREGQLRRQQIDLELRALRAQMNPHFMFNCLNAIYHCIQTNNTEQAGNYLLKFSFLTRRVLENSSQQWISLREDIEMLRAYMDLEQLRSSNRFTYEVSLARDIDVENVSVPMLLTQPFIENSIWHGFHESQQGAKITLEIVAKDNRLYYHITDNGVVAEKREGTLLNGAKRISMGTTLVREQLKAIRQLEKADADFEIRDLGIGNTSGKQVTLYLPLRMLN